MSTNCERRGLISPGKASGASQNCEGPRGEIRERIQRNPRDGFVDSQTAQNSEGAHQLGGSEPEMANREGEGTSPLTAASSNLEAGMAKP